jgi:hypothetical protein
MYQLIAQRDDRFEKDKQKKNPLGQCSGEHDSMTNLEGLMMAAGNYSQSALL